MSVYYRENSLFLKQACDSMLSQTIPPEEFVLVCDGPLTEELNAVVDEYKQKAPSLFHIVTLPENKGLAAALNAGLSECSCSWIARMDSDDIALSDRMEKQFACAARSGAGLLSGTIAEFSCPEGKIRSAEEIASEIDSLSKRSLPTEDKKIRRFSRNRNPMNHPAVLMKKEDVLAAGGYDEAYPYFEDYDLWLRMLKKGVKAANTEETVLLMRADAGLYDRRSGKEYRKYMKAFRKRMLREKDCNLWEYVTSIVTRTVVAWVPSGMRKKFYGTVLRR